MEDSTDERALNAANQIQEILSEFCLHETILIQISVTASFFSLLPPILLETFIGSVIDNVNQEREINKKEIPELALYLKNLEEYLKSALKKRKE